LQPYVELDGQTVIDLSFINVFILRLVSLGLRCQVARRVVYQCDEEKADVLSIIPVEHPPSCGVEFHIISEAGYVFMTTENVEVFIQDLQNMLDEIKLRKAVST
jgi:hypothetical protein